MPPPAGHSQPSGLLGGRGGLVGLGDDDELQRADHLRAGLKRLGGAEQGGLGETVPGMQLSRRA